MAKRKMYAFRADIEVNERIRNLGFSIGKFYRDAAKEKLDRVTAEILSENIDRLPDEEKQIALGKQIAVKENDITAIEQDPTYRKCVATLRSEKEITEIIQAQFRYIANNITELRQVYNSGRANLTNYDVKISLENKPGWIRRISMEEFLNRADKIQRDVRLCRDLYSAYQLKIAKIRRKISDLRDQIEQLSKRRMENKNSDAKT